jgi:hypothetical protein
MITAGQCRVLKGGGKKKPARGTKAKATASKDRRRRSPPASTLALSIANEDVRLS